MNKLRALKNVLLAFIGHTPPALSCLLGCIGEVKLISRCSFNRLQGPAGELQKGLRASWPDDMNCPRGSCFLPSAWGLPLVLTILFFWNELRLVVPSHEVCGYGCGES